MEWGNNPNTWVALLIAIGAVLAAGRWIGGVSQFNKSVKKTLETIQEDIKKIFHQLAGETSATSPMTLTELGKKLAKEVNADELAADIVSKLKSKIQGLNPYRVQQLCLEYVENEYDPPADVVDAIERVAYENGRQVEGVRRVIAVVVRDKLLETDT